MPLTREEAASGEFQRAFPLGRLRRASSRGVDLVEKVAEFRQALLRHIKNYAYENVNFIECTNSTYDPDEEDYRVAYEAVFQPRDLKHAYLKISITEEGYVGSGFETRLRVAERLGSTLWTAKQAFAAGRELASIEPEELVGLVRLAGRGKLMLHIGWGFNFRGVGSMRAVIAPDDFETIPMGNPRHWDWITVMTELKSCRRDGASSDLNLGNSVQTFPV